MSITNLNNTHLTAAQVTAATTALKALENELGIVNVNLEMTMSFMAGTTSPGYETKVNEMKPFFTRATASSTQPTE